MLAALPSPRQVVHSSIATPNSSVISIAPAGQGQDQLLGLITRIREASADPEARVIVLPDLGSVDVLNTAALTADLLRDRMATLIALSQVLPTLPQPVVGIAHGAIRESGCHLATCCDVVLADADATFALNTPDAVIPPAVQTLAVSSAIGRRSAVALASTAQTISAHQAHELGLITEVASADSLDQRARDLTSDMSTLDPTAVALGRSVYALTGVRADQFEEALEAMMCAHGIAVGIGPSWIDTHG